MRIPECLGQYARAGFSVRVEGLDFAIHRAADRRGADALHGSPRVGSEDVGQRVA